MPTEDIIERVISARGLSKITVEGLANKLCLDVGVKKHDEKGKFLVSGPRSHITMLSVEVNAHCFGR